MRVIIEVREKGNNHTTALDVVTNNWLDEKRNNADRRQGVIDAANHLLRSLRLAEIDEAKDV
ncbi:hypothetical protein PP353_gp46 [Arthrobacter phage Kumotta]|uniref:Uncharacterized protein n=1 Tax=Arthrobacter phage Kumotta TaxID=2588498 RepID=A0A4Y6ELF9_9CAUD|nr:hypothetical protein PP353_gp46 [Arthrobacter phage Kumotta]QDF19556.1 hypothetical protein SEA_KUMOTTA_46 [Arthrobacter phage Kumotta]